MTYSLRMYDPSGGSHTNVHMGPFVECENGCHLFSLASLAPKSRILQVYPGDPSKYTFYGFDQENESLYAYCRHNDGTWEAMGSVSTVDVYLYFSTLPSHIDVAVVAARCLDEADNKISVLC